ncbi:MAG: hypothetical protein ABMA25_10055 [Ilumatobacteraceae bacterium]
MSDHDTSNAKTTTNSTTDLSTELGFWVIPVDVRRAVLGVFFRAGGGPLTLEDVVTRCREESGLDLSRLDGVRPGQRVSDILRHQVRFGRAEVVARGTYRLFIGEFSDSTRWRCLHWRQAAHQRNQRPRWGDRVFVPPPAAPPPPVP